MRLDQIIKRPLLTEKSNIQKIESNKIQLEVDMRANRSEVRKAVETLFDVKVLSVNIQKVRGKAKRVGRTYHQEPAWKKAIVQLAEGSDVQFIEGV